MCKIISKFASSLFVVLFISCNGGNNTDSISDNNTTTQQEISIEDRVRNAQSIDEVNQLLNGTTWHYTENLDDSDIGCWIKVEFNNGNYTSYYALPSDGQWTRDESGVYELKEGYYSNTGEKYISVHWDGNIKNPRLGLTIPCDMALTIDHDAVQLNVHSSQIDAVLYNGHGSIKPIIMTGQMEYGDTQWN